MPEMRRVPIDPPGPNQSRRAGNADVELFVGNRKATQERHVFADLCEAETDPSGERRILALALAASVNIPERKNTHVTAPASSQDNDEDYLQENLHSEQHPTQQQQSKKRSVFSQKWTAVIEALTFPIKQFLLTLTRYAASYPYVVVASITVFSILIVLIGWQTNFYLESRENELWRPIGSMSSADGRWVDSTIGEWEDDYLIDARRLISIPSFPSSSERPGTEAGYKQRRLVGGSSEEDYIALLIHRNGKNVVSIDGCDRLFEAHDTAITTPDFADICAAYGDSRQCPKGFEMFCEMYNIPTGEDAPYTCQCFGPTAFFLHSLDNYKSRAKTDRDVQVAMSLDVFPGEYEEFSLKHIIGYPDLGEDGILKSGESFTTIFSMPNTGEGPDLSLRVVHRLLELREQWSRDPDNPFSLELFATVSFSEEFKRGIVKDIPLAFLAFVLMSLFTMLVFSKFDGCSFDWVNSRSTLGFGAICCILLSTMTGYGLLFCFGVPFTALTQLLIFIMFGIGLDDAFIIMTAYERSDPEKDVVDRVHDTIEEIGLSIFMTTATSVLAFGLGCLSTTPAIRWLCLYASPTIAIDFIYQVTFFIGLLVIDERRVKSRRRDWMWCLVSCMCCPITILCGFIATLCCFKVPELRWIDQGIPQIPAETNTQRKHFSERIMIGYTKILLRPRIKVLVLVLFSVLFAACLYSASLMKVAFDFTNVLPSDSYLIDFNDAYLAYAQNPAIRPVVYFRFVDQSDPVIQVQMKNYVNDLVEQVAGLTEEPLHFWLHHYKAYVEENINELFWLSFNETLHMFLAMEENERYREDLILDSEGNIEVSRTRIDLDNLDLTSVDDYLGSFRAIRKVGEEQPLNQKGDWAFFTFAKIFYLWEFLNNTEAELLNTVIYCVAAVSAMALVIMPHWSAVLFLAPMVTVLFIDLMGFLQFFGITINGISYIALVMSIGLVS